MKSVKTCFKCIKQWRGNIYHPRLFEEGTRIYCLYCGYEHVEMSPTLEEDLECQKEIQEVLNGE
jgi:DNA-directed RNA polymerase subunit RPC12/RpoP